MVVNLEYGLDDHPEVNFHEDGVEYERQLSSRYTCRDVIMKLASTLHAKRCTNSCSTFRLLLVATHPDCVSHVEAKIDELNQELQKLLLPAFEDELIVYEENKIVFVLNLKNPDSGDKDRLKVIRKKIGQPGLGNTLDVPSSFFIFEQDLIEYAEQDVKRDVLSLDECRRVGTRLQMTDEVVEAALVFFHRHNTFLHFQHVLPNHVFVKPQVPLDIINGIIRFSYKLSAGKLRGFPVKFSTQLKEGIITEELLGYDGEVYPHFQEGFYEARDAIKLFCHTFTIAPLHPEAPVVDSKKEYLMMSLKPAIPDAELSNFIPQSHDRVQLVFKFSSGCVPLGCFGSTISCLLSQYQWRVVRKDGKPKCLANNIAALHDPDILVDVVLVDLTHHIEVHIDSNLTDPVVPVEEIFSQIGNKVRSAIEKVFEIMHLDTGKIKIYSSVFCTCGKEPEHLAVFEPHKGKQFLRCNSSDSAYSPTEEQLLWMGTHVSKPGSTLADSPGLAILVTCDYGGGKEGLGALPGTKEDARELTETFIKYLGYAPHVLHNPTKVELQAKMQEVSDMLEIAEGDQKVIVFAFSGHGCSRGSAEKLYTNDGEVLDFQDEIVLPLTRQDNAYIIPKLFFIDACRGSETLSVVSKGSETNEATAADGNSPKAYFEKLVQHVSGNFRIDYATIPRHVSYAGTGGSLWMPKMARAIREHYSSIQDISAAVKSEVHKALGENKQQCESVDRMNVGPLFLSKHLHNKNMYT